MNTRDPEALRSAFYESIEPLSMAPLWTRLKGLVRREPAPGEAYRWSYGQVRPYLMESATHISAEEAERRVLILENPAFRGASRVTPTLFAGLQLIMPGEIAPAHRHTQSALRFIIEGSGAYTTIDDEKVVMHPGDFIVTPAWRWHTHGNETPGPMVWLDGLDIPMVQLLDASFAEGLKQDQQKITRTVGDSFARYGHNLLPVDEKRKSKTSPIFNYPYSHTRQALETARLRNEWDACHGLKLKFSNPETGDYAMPTIGTFIQLLPKGFKTARYRSTDATVFAAIEGKGRTRIGEQAFEWGPRDLFVVPSWQWVTHEADADSVLFSFSDRPVQQKLDLFREDRGNA